MKNKVKLLILFNFIILFILTGFSALKEEKYRKQETFYLELSPVDPRSLMQGDYMILNYVITDLAWEKIKEIQKKEGKALKRGYIVLKLDENKVAHYEDVVKEISNDKNKIFISFKFNSYKININADTFFFQEGDAKIYENAKFSEVVNINNTLRLVGLVDENKNILK